MIEKKYRSKCCNALVKTEGIPDFPGTKEVCTVSFACTKCDQACDVIQKKLASSQRVLRKQLLQRIKERLPELEELLKEQSVIKEDVVYRFYHHSAHLYTLKGNTKIITDELRQLLADRNLNQDFEAIFQEGTRKGTQKEFMTKSMVNWRQEASPIVLAFWNAYYFLEMAIKCGKELKKSPSSIPIGWAALLHLYNIR